MTLFSVKLAYVFLASYLLSSITIIGDPIIRLFNYLVSSAIYGGWIAIYQNNYNMSEVLGYVQFDTNVLNIASWAAFSGFYTLLFAFVLIDLIRSSCKNSRTSTRRSVHNDVEQAHCHSHLDAKKELDAKVKQWSNDPYAAVYYPITSNPITSNPITSNPLAQVPIVGTPPTF